jgi:hypothetical protein
MDEDKLVICTEEDFEHHRNALDVVNFDRLEELVDDDHLIIRIGKSFWDALNEVIVYCTVFNGRGCKNWHGRNDGGSPEELSRPL